MQITVDKTFIVHLEKLNQRKNYLDNEINNKLGFENFEYIISNDETDKKILENNNYKYMAGHYGQLTNPEICNYEVQFKIWERISMSEYENILIVEDDIIFKDNFNDIFSNLLMNVPDDFSICFVSECCNLYKKNPNNLRFLESDTSRCCNGYLINKTTCQKLTQVKEFHFPVDHHLNFVKNNLGLKYYWSDPTLFTHGSAYNYKSNAERGR